MLVSVDTCETSKGIAEVVDFFQNYGLLYTCTQLFSLRDELCWILDACFRNKCCSEVVSDQCDGSLIITE
jgi:hypothetical protein